MRYSWSLSGRAVEGPKEYKDKHLRPIVVEDDVYWGVMKYWFPNLQMATDAELTAAKPVPAPSALETPEKKTGTRKTRRPAKRPAAQ